MLCDAVQGLGRMAIPGRAGPGRRFRPQDPRSQGRRRPVDACRRRAGAVDSWRRAGAGHALGTLSPALCVGFGEAARLAAERRDADAIMLRNCLSLRDNARTRLDDQWQREHRYRGNLNIRREGLDARTTDLRLAQYRLLAGLGLRQRIGPAKPCAARDRSQRSRRRARRSASASAATPGRRSWPRPAAGSTRRRMSRGSCRMIKVRFLKADGTLDHEVEAPAGTNLLDLAQARGPAAGRRLRRADGLLDLPRDRRKEDFGRLPPASEEEDDLLDLAWAVRPTSRLACQINLTDGSRHADGADAGRGLQSGPLIALIALGKRQRQFECPHLLPCGAWRACPSAGSVPRLKLGQHDPPCFCARRAA